jgi:hypothetical protein
MQQHYLSRLTVPPFLDCAGADVTELTGQANAIAAGVHRVNAIESFESGAERACSDRDAARHSAREQQRRIRVVGPLVCAPQP